MTQAELDAETIRILKERLGPNADVIIYTAREIARERLERLWPFPTTQRPDPDDDMRDG